MAQLRNLAESSTPKDRLLRQAWTTGGTLSCSRGVGAMEATMFRICGGSRPAIFALCRVPTFSGIMSTVGGGCVHTLIFCDHYLQIELHPVAT